MLPPEAQPRAESLRDVSARLALRWAIHQAKLTGAVVGSLGLVTFGLFGTLSVMTQFLQFGLGYSALHAGVRVLPEAGAIAIVAPLSTLLVQAVGTKLTVGAGSGQAGTLISRTGPGR